MAIRAWPVARQYLAVLLIIFAVKQAFNVVVFPPFTGHDEVVHYAYIRTVATEHRVPVIPDLEEWQEAWSARRPMETDYLPTELYQYCRYVLDWNYCTDPRYIDNPPRGVTLSGELFPHGWQYAANHPPLYYLLMTPIYLAIDGVSLETQQYILRAAAIPIGLVIVLLTYLIAGLLFPADRLIKAVAPTFVAFQTQVSYEAAMINNDIVLIAIFTLLIYMLIRGIRSGFTLHMAAAIGLVLGLGLLTKGSMIGAVPLIAFAFVAGEGPRRVKRWLALGGVSVAAAGLVAWPWFAFLYRTYGNLTGLEQIKALQFKWTYRFQDAPSFFDLLFNRGRFGEGFAQLRWRETWGEFGWRLIHLDTWLLAAIGVPLLVLAVTAIAALVRASWQRFRRIGEAGLSREQVLGLWLLIGVALISYAAMVEFGTTFALTQARYYFQAVGAVAIVIAYGLSVLVPRSWRPYASGVFLALMVTANLVIYTQYVIPYWYLAS